MKTPKAEVLRHFHSVDPRLAQIIKKIDFSEWFEDELLHSDLIFKSLCRTIVGQQLAGSAAKAIYTRFENLLHSAVTPDSVLAADPAQIRAAGLSWAKVRSVIDLSTKVKNAEISLENLAHLSDEDLISELVKVKGIGRWTAEMFLMFKLGREDIYSWGDLGLRNGLKKFFNGSEMTQAQLENFVRSWAPYRTYGAIAMWHLLDNR